jgi:hypothetical protein
MPANHGTPKSETRYVPNNNVMVANCGTLCDVREIARAGRFNVNLKITQRSGTDAHKRRSLPNFFTYYRDSRKR